MTANRDLARLHTSLRPIEEAAAALPWAARRPWRVHSHLWLEGRLPIVDLHDLGVKQARAAVDAVAAEADGLEAGAVCFIVGRGRHGIGGSKLGPAVRRALRRHCRARPWRFHPGPPGRVILVVDAARAPASATGRPGALFWVGALLFLVAATIASPLLGAGVAALLLAYAWSVHREGRR